MLLLTTVRVDQKEQVWSELTVWNFQSKCSVSCLLIAINHWWPENRTPEKAYKSTAYLGSEDVKCTGWIFNRGFNFPPPVNSHRDRYSLACSSVSCHFLRVCRVMRLAIGLYGEECPLGRGFNVLSRFMPKFTTLCLKKACDAIYLSIFRILIARL